MKKNGALATKIICIILLLVALPIWLSYFVGHVEFGQQYLDGHPLQKEHPIAFIGIMWLTGLFILAFIVFGFLGLILTAEKGAIYTVMVILAFVIWITACMLSGEFGKGIVEGGFILMVIGFSLTIAHGLDGI